MVAHLEARAQSGYMHVIHQLIDETQLQPGQSVLEVGCGPGAVVRRLAQRTSGRNPIVAVDVNRYLLGEADALARRDGVDGMIEFKEADAEHLPFEGNRFDVTLACTVLEEGDADRMLAELVRVTTPGGRVGVVVRSIDMPRWIKLKLGPALKAKVEDPGLIGGNVQERGCADASLYRRMRKDGIDKPGHDAAMDKPQRWRTSAIYVQPDRRHAHSRRAQRVAERRSRRGGGRHFFHCRAVSLRGGNEAVRLLVQSLTFNAQAGDLVP